MTTRNGTLSRRTTLVIATLAVFGSAPAQNGFVRLDVDLRDATTTVADSMHHRVKTTQPAQASARPISDDGGNGDDWNTTRQLVIALGDGSSVELRVELLNETGQHVRTDHYTTSAGQRTVPVDVTGLARGRYAARISNGTSDRVVRFRR